MMTKRLPNINHHRPYKYQELRRKFKTGAESSAARGEEEYRQLLRSRERTTLATGRSNTNLGVSRENLAASRDSLVIPEENNTSNETGGKTSAEKNKPPRGAARQNYEELRQGINTRQTSLDHMTKRTEEGKPVYSFTLSKVDRSKSEPMLFPPLNDRLKAAKASQQLDRQQAPSTKQKINEHLPPQSTVPVEKKEKENKPISNIKFPIVSRYDLYKHLGISQNRRKRIRRDAEFTENRHSRIKQPVPLQQQTPRIMPETSGKSQSRNVTVIQSNREDRKIEMYKQWHEDQSNQRKLHDFETADAVRLSSTYKERYQPEDTRPRNNERLPTRNRRDSTLPKIGLRDRSNAGRVMETIADGGQTDRSRRDSQSQATNQRAESPPAPVPEDLIRRQYSANTWKTWRHHNDSYAYDDVDKYIEENELMDDEKMFFIRQWIVVVSKAMLEDDPDSDDDDIDNDVGTIQGSLTDNSDPPIVDTNLTKIQIPQP